MSPWTCPECGTDQVVSVREWTRVFNYRDAIREDGRRIASTLTSRGVAVKGSEDAQDACKRWAAQDGDLGPGYICASCHRAWGTREVPA